MEIKSNLLSRADVNITHLLRKSLRSVPAGYPFDAVGEADVHRLKWHEERKKAKTHTVTAWLFRLYRGSYITLDFSDYSLYENFWWSTWYRGFFLVYKHDMLTDQILQMTPGHKNASAIYQAIRAGSGSEGFCRKRNADFTSPEEYTTENEATF